jgi:hypothetical protein
VLLRRHGDDDAGKTISQGVTPASLWTTGVPVDN